LVNDIEIAIRFKTILESGNDLVRNMEKRPFYGAHAYSGIHTALVIALAITMARIFDIGSRRFPRNKQAVASIPALIHLLDQRRCRQALIRRADEEWTPGFRQGAACERAINGAVGSYRTFRRSPTGRRAMSALRELRNARIAHFLYETKPTSPLFAELFDMVTLAKGVIEKTRLSVLGSHQDSDGLSREFRRQADAFWAPALAAILAADK
jgi:hypothetical protein